MTAWPCGEPNGRGDGSHVQVRRLAYSYINPKNTSRPRTLHAIVVVAEELPEVIDIDLSREADPPPEEKSHDLRSPSASADPKQTREDRLSSVVVPTTLSMSCGCPPISERVERVD